MAVLAVCGAISPVAAQQKKPPKPPPAAKPAKPPAPGKIPANIPQPKTAQELDRFSKMPPEDREKALAKLPPQRRAAFEQRLARYEQLTPEQRETIKRRVEQMESLPKDRQNAVRQEIQRLRALPFGQRKRALNGEEFRQKFSPDEQSLVRDSFPNIQKQQQD